MSNRTSTALRAISYTAIQPGEELTNARHLPLYLVQEDPKQPRRGFDQDAMNELLGDIEERGILCPIWVRPIGTNGDGESIYRVIAGGRRYRAAVTLGLESIPAMILETMSDDEAHTLAMVENLKRSNLSLLDEASYYYELRLRGMSLREVASSVGKPVNYINRRVKLYEVPGALEAYERGLLSNLDLLLDPEAAEQVQNILGTQLGSAAPPNDPDTGAPVSVPTPSSDTRRPSALTPGLRYVQQLDRQAKFLTRVRKAQLDPTERDQVKKSLDDFIERLTSVRQQLDQ